MLFQVSVHDANDERTQGSERADEIAVSLLVREFVKLRVMEFNADLELDVGTFIGEQARCCTIPITSRISGFVCAYY